MNETLRSTLLGIAACVFLAGPARAQAGPGDAGRDGRPTSPREHGAIFPPWQHGANNDAQRRGLEFTVPPVDVLADFHGDMRVGTPAS